MKKNNSFNPKNLFLKTKTNKYSYKDLFHFSAHFSSQVKKYDLRKNQPIGLCGAPSDEMIFIIASCWILEISFTVFNHHLPDQKMERQIQWIQPGLIIADHPKRMNERKTVTFDSFNLKEILAATQEPDSSSYFKTLAENTSNKEKIFGYFFTSGTSSAPKIVSLKRRQMISAAKSSAQNILPAPNECWLLCMPLFHVGGVSIILRSILYGSGIFHLPEFEKKEVAHQLSTDTDIVAVSLVPTMLKRLIESGEFAVHEAFQAVLLGGGPVSPNLIETCIEKNIPVITSYGMTETCAQIAANPILEFPDDDDRLQSAGRIFKPNKIDVRDQHNQSVPTGISGSIWIKGPQVFDGYYEKNSDKCGNSDWFNTGDYGHVDESGWMFIEARRTDLIITGGENVSPKEVENTLEQFKPIKEAAVFGIPDEEWGQRIAAALVLFPSASINQKDLKNRLKKELAAFKVPKQFFFVDQIPRTHNGKIKRAELRKFIDTQNSIFL